MPFRGEYFGVPQDVATARLTGDVICDSWWMVDQSGGLLFWSRKPLVDVDPKALAIEVSPQCNADRRILDHFRGTVNQEVDVVQVPVVYMSSVKAHVRTMAGVPMYAVPVEPGDPAVPSVGP